MATMYDEYKPSDEREVKAEKAVAAVEPMFSNESNDTIRIGYADGTGCEAEYKVRAFWPQVACKPEAFANPTDANANDRCAGESGINPDFDTVCLPSYDGKTYCSPNPAKDIPFFK